MTNYEKTVHWWKSKHISNDAELSEALNSYRIMFAYNSGKIENDKITFHDTREIFEHNGVTSYTGDLRTLFEIRNAKAAYEVFLNAYQEHRILDETLIKAFQFEITQNTYDTRRWKIGERPGEYKKHDYVTGRDEIGASAEGVQEEMQELLEELDSIPDEKALTAAAYFHVKFENIHPFADGNGRTGRLAMNYFLVQHNHPPITIFEEDRLAYYNALESWDKDQELDSMKTFLKEEVYKTWKKQIEKMETLTMNSPSLTEFLDMEDDPQ